MSTKSSSQAGFTLVEVAVVVPMMILIVLALMALLIALVNGIATPTKQTGLASSSNKTFDSITSDITSSSGFLNSVPAGTYSDPNSSNYSSPPASTEVLIVQSYNQVKDPTDSTGTKTLPAFKGTAPCGALSLTKDNVVPIAIIYFVRDSILWRRVLTDIAPGSTCNSPLLIQQTCPVGACTNEDTPLTQATTTEFKITYYDSGAGSTVVADKSLAQSILISLKSSIPSGDATATNSSILRITRLSH